MNEKLYQVLQWGWKLFVLFSIEVRIHLFFVIWVVMDLLRAATDGYFYWGLLHTVTLFGIVLLHEYGHCFAGRAVGGYADRILLWPLGGLAFVHADMQPTKQLIVAAGGPAVNVAIGLLLAPYIFMGSGEFGSHFLHLSPPGFYNDPISVLYGINFDLFVFNLIPAFPMDGGRILRSLLWYRMGLRRATIVSVYVAYVFLGGMLLFGLWLFTQAPPESRSLILPALAIFLFFSASQEKKMVESGYIREEQRFSPGGEFSDSFDLGGEPRRPSWFVRWRERREALRSERAARDRLEVERRVDALLEKVGRDGLPSLSPRERRFLRNASRRYKR